MSGEIGQGLRDGCPLRGRAFQHTLFAGVQWDLNKRLITLRN